MPFHDPIGGFAFRRPSVAVGPVRSWSGRVRYEALATDYDGTIATAGRVDDATLAALEELRRTGRRLVLVTGRTLDDLQRVLPHTDLLERIVAENGAVVHAPGSREVRVLAEAPLAIVRRLRRPGLTGMPARWPAVRTRRSPAAAPSRRSRGRTNPRGRRCGERRWRRVAARSDPRT